MDAAIPSGHDTVFVAHPPHDFGHHGPTHDRHDDVGRSDLGPLAQPPDSKREDRREADREEKETQEQGRNGDPSEFEKNHAHEERVDHRIDCKNEMGTDEGQQPGTREAPRHEE